MFFIGLLSRNAERSIPIAVLGVLVTHDRLRRTLLFGIVWRTGDFFTTPSFLTFATEEVFFVIASLSPSPSVCV